MGELRERMEADLRLPRMSENTRLAYLPCVRDFAALHHRSPAEMGVNLFGSRLPTRGPSARASLYARRNRHRS